IVVPPTSSGVLSGAVYRAHPTTQTFARTRDCKQCAAVHLTSCLRISSSGRSRPWTQSHYSNGTTRLSARCSGASSAPVGLRRVMDRKQLAELGSALQAAKATAPTKPHPHLPDEPPLLPLVGVAAGVVDLARTAGESALKRIRC